ncbi:MAG: hypothetical protein AAB864_01265 [Patescibacteria group bacterium]
MNKNYIAVIVLIAVLFSYNQASAGMLDWVGSKLSTSLVGSDALPFEQLYSAIADTSENDVPARPVSKAPATPVKKAISKTYVVSVSAYSSTPDQTDDSPFITASNTYVRDGIVATNMLPFGTRVKIPKLFGNKIFVVEDRMNKRYTYNLDIWFPNRESAKRFGRKTVTIEVLPL